MSEANASENLDLYPCCPFCAKAHAQLYAVEFDAETKTLMFRCGGCRRSWEAEEYVRSIGSTWSRRINASDRDQG